MTRRWSRRGASGVQQRLTTFAMVPFVSPRASEEAVVCFIASLSCTISACRSLYASHQPFSLSFICEDTCSTFFFRHQAFGIRVQNRFKFRVRRGEVSQFLQVHTLRFGCASREALRSLGGWFCVIKVKKEDKSTCFWWVERVERCPVERYPGLGGFVESSGLWAPALMMSRGR